MSRRKKIFIALGILLIIGVIAFFVWYFFFRGTTPPQGGGTFPGPGDEIPGSGDGEPTVLPDSGPKVFKPILRQLSEVPIAGAVLGTRAGTPIARYVERATGNVFEIGADGEGEKRLTRTTIPKVTEALWSKSGTGVIARYVRDASEVIESFSGKIVPGTSGTDGELEGVFLPRGIPDAAVSPDGTKVFFLQIENSGVSGIRSDFSGNAKTKLWASPVSEWLVSWPSPDTVALLSKPSAFSSGMLISLNPSLGGSRLLLRNIPGLTALLNPVNSKLLYSQSGDTGITTSVFDTITGRGESFPLTTFPEKCVWTKAGDKVYCGVPAGIPTGTYPDVWYQGVIAFSDAVWSIDPVTKATAHILDVSEERGAPLDIVNPQVSADEKFLLFTEKEGGTLWSLQMKE